MRSTDVERRFLQVCKRIVDAEREVPEEVIRGGGIIVHVTDLVNPCMRHLFYQLNAPPHVSVEGVLRMWEGQALHAASVLTRNHELLLFHKFNEVYVVGSVDEYERGILIEKKFVNFVPSTETQLQKYYSHYIDQVRFYSVLCYLNGYDVERAYLLFVNRGFSNERNPFVKAFDITHFLDYERDLNLLSARLSSVMKVMNSKEMPEIPDEYHPFEHPCSSCMFRALCWMEEEQAEEDEYEENNTGAAGAQEKDRGKRRFAERIKD